MFKCPNCDARYKLVRVEAPPSHDRQLALPELRRPPPESGREIRPEVFPHGRVAATGRSRTEAKDHLESRTRRYALCLAILTVHYVAIVLAG